MNFKEATDGLFNRVSHEDLAEQLGISIAAIRQARLDPDAKAYRAPPKGLERAVIDLAENRIRHYHQLLGSLQRVQPTIRAGPDRSGMSYTSYRIHNILKADLWYIHMSDWVLSGYVRKAFLSRAVAALCIKKLADVDVETAAKAITDGFNLQWSRCNLLRPKR